MTTWLFVGSSATAPFALSVARSENIIDKIVTCNSGIKLVPTPDVYFCADYTACFAFRDAARLAQVNGTKLVSTNKPVELRASNCIDFYDEFLAVGAYGDEPTRHKWGAFFGSGPCCIEYALRRGAGRVVLVGCEGYIHNGPDDYFDGASMSRLFHRNANAPTLELLQPRMNQLTKLWPEVECVCYGEPHYRVSQPNWKVIPL